MKRTQFQDFVRLWKVFMVLLGASLVPLAKGDDVPKGSDMFVTLDDGSTFIDFGDPDAPAIPADFFGPGSVAFTELVPLKGAPLVCTVPCAGVDTIVERLATAVLPALGSSAMVPVQIRALHLESTSPITVTFSSGGPSTYDVEVFLSEVCPQGIGSMTINHEYPDGGTFTSELPVTAKVVFKKVSGAPGFPTVTLDPPDCSVTDVFEVPPAAPAPLRSAGPRKAEMVLADFTSQRGGNPCEGQPDGASCNQDGSDCTADTCNEGVCVPSNLPNNTPCDDGLFCTATDVCSSGTCDGSGSPCLPAFVCDEATDICLEPMAGWWAHQAPPGDTIYAVPAGNADHDGDGFIVETGLSDFPGNAPNQFNVGARPGGVPGGDHPFTKLTPEEAKWAAHGVIPPNVPPPPPNDGACCDHATPGGVCTNGAQPSDCVGGQKQFFKDEFCADIEAAGLCGEHTGACCVVGVCTDDVPQSQCASEKWYKDTPCSDPTVDAICDAQAPNGGIPTVSEWGLVILALTLLVGAKIYYRRRKPAEA